MSRSSYRLAFEESYGYFDDIDDTFWLKMQNKARSQSIFQSPKNPDNSIEYTAQWMMDNVDPIFRCPLDLRVGGLGDGSKWTCDPHRLATKDDCLIYSIGSEGNYMFEDGMFQLLGRHCEIHVFDPNPKHERPHDVETKNIHYHAWGMTSSDAGTTTFGTEKFISFPETLKELGHTDRRIDILKIDCDGCEWTSYKDWLHHSVDIRQLLIETHPNIAFAYNVSFGGYISDLLQHGFVPFSKEANVNPGADPYGTIYEWSFIRLKPTFLRYTPMH